MTIENSKTNNTNNIDKYDEDYYSNDHDFYKIDENGNFINEDIDLFIKKLILSEKNGNLTIGQFIRKRKIHKILGKERPSEVIFYDEDKETGKMIPFSNSLRIFSLQAFLKTMVDDPRLIPHFEEDLYPDTTLNSITPEPTITEFYHSTENPEYFTHYFDSDISSGSSILHDNKSVLKNRSVKWNVADRTIKFRAGNLYKSRNRKMNNEEKPYISRKEYLEIIKSQNNTLIKKFDAYKTIKIKNKIIAKKITLSSTNKKNIEKIIDNYIDFSKREHFLELSEKYIKTRKKLQFSPGYTGLLTSILEIIISKHIFKHSTSKQGFYCKPNEIEKKVIRPIKTEIYSLWHSIQTIFHTEIKILENIEDEEGEEEYKKKKEKNQKNIILLNKKLDQIAMSMKSKTDKILSSRPFSDIYKDKKEKGRLNTIYFENIGSKITPANRKFTITKKNFKLIEEIFNTTLSKNEIKEIKIETEKETEKETDKETDKFKDDISQAIKIGNARIFRKFITDAATSFIADNESFSFGDSEKQIATDAKISDFVYSINENVDNNLKSITSEFLQWRVWPKINKNLTAGLIKMSKEFLDKSESDRLLSYLHFSKFIEYIKEIIILVQLVEKNEMNFKKNTKELRETIGNIKENIQESVFPLSELIKKYSGFHLKFSTTPSEKKKKLPYFKNRPTTLKAISEWFAFHFEKVQTCQTILVGLDIPGKKEQIFKLVKRTCDLIPILKEHQKKPYILWVQDTITGTIHSILKNNKFDIEILKQFYVDLKNANFPDFPALYFKNLISVDFFKRLTSEDDSVEPNNILLNRFYDILQSETHITKFYQKLINSTNENFPSMDIHKYYRWLKLNFCKEENAENKQRILDAIDKRSLLIPLNHDDFKGYFDKRYGSGYINKKHFVLTDINFLKAITGKIVVASENLTSDSSGTFSTIPSVITDNFQEWFDNSNEPPQIKKYIKKGEEHIKIVYNLQKKYKLDFSSSDQISNAENSIKKTKEALIEEDKSNKEKLLELINENRKINSEKINLNIENEIEKKKEEIELSEKKINKLSKNKVEIDQLQKKINKFEKNSEKDVENIKNVLKNPPYSKKSYFSIFAKKLRLIKISRINYDDIVLNYKELIFKKKLVKGNHDQVHVIRDNTKSSEIRYYYVFDIEINSKNRILLSSRMKYNEKFPYHQSLEILFNNLPFTKKKKMKKKEEENKEEERGIKIYSYNNSTSMYPMGYYFDVFDHYFDLKEKFYDPAISVFFNEDKINNFSFDNLRKSLEKSLQILRKIYVKEVYNYLKSEKVSGIDEIYKIIENNSEITQENLKIAIKLISKGKNTPKFSNTLLKKIDEIDEFNQISNYTYEDLNNFRFSVTNKKDKDKKKQKNIFDLFKKNPNIIKILGEENKRIKILMALTKYRFMISEYFPEERHSEFLEKSFKASFQDIKKTLEPYLFDTRVPKDIFHQKRKNLKRRPDLIKLYHLFKRFKEICFLKDIPLIFFGKRKNDAHFMGFSGLITFPAIQIEPSGDVSILNSWQKLYYEVNPGFSSVNITGVDLGLRTPVAIGDVTFSESSDGTSKYNTHYSQAISEEKIDEMGKEEILNNRDNLISQANIISKKNIKKALKLQRIAQKYQKKKSRLYGRPYFQSAIYKSSLSVKQGSINTTVSHKLASSIIQYAKTKTSEEINIDFNSKKVPNFENSFLRINTENLHLTTKKKDPFAVQKSQWIYGKINKFLEESCRIQGIKIFTYTPPAYTSKISHLTHSEGKKGYLVKINTTEKEIIVKDHPSNSSNIADLIEMPLIRRFIFKIFKKNKWFDDGMYHSTQLENKKKKFLIKVITKKEIIVKNSPSVPTSIVDWLKEGTNKSDLNLHPLVRNAILRRFRVKSWRGFKFIPLGSGNIILLNPNGETIDQKDSFGNDLTGRIIIDRDSNAAINIATYNPFLYSANVINLQIDRINKNENISKAQKRIKSKITDLISKFRKALDYHLYINNFSYNYLNLIQIPEDSHRKLAETIYNGIIYHINMPRKDNWFKNPETSPKKPPTFNDWMRHIETKSNVIWEDPEKRKEIYHIRSQTKEDFIENISKNFNQPSQIANTNSDLENFIMFFEKELNNEAEYGTIPIKSLIKLSSVDSASADYSDEIDDAEKIGISEQIK